MLSLFQEMTHAIKTFLAAECRHWHRYELLWIGINLAVILTTAIATGDTRIGTTSAVTGILYVLLACKGKRSAYLFGIVNVILYAIISWEQRLFGETMLNILYYLPLQIIGFILWSRHLNEASGEVIPGSLTWKKRGLLLLALALCVFGYGQLLKHFGDPLPYIDAFTTVASIFAMTFSVKRLVEQWPIWTAVNALSIYMWWMRYLENRENAATLAMWVIFLGNAFYGWTKWTLDLRREEKTK